MISPDIIATVDGKPRGSLFLLFLRLLPKTVGVTCLFSVITKKMLKIGY